MPEYDAFGREIKEGGTPATPESSTPPTPEPAAPTAPTEPKLKLSGSPPRGGGSFAFPGVAVAVIVMAIVIAAGAYIAFKASDSVDKAIRQFTPTLPNLTVAAPEETRTPTTTPAPPAPKPPPVGLGPRSLIRHAAFADAIAQVRHGLGRLTNLRVAADRIDVQLVTKRGELRNVQVNTTDGLRKLSLSGTGFNQVPTMAFSAIDTRAPERLVRGAVRRGGVKASGIDYLVMSEFGGQIVWNAYFKNNVRYQGDEHGRVQRKF